MEKRKLYERIAGALFLLAMITSLTGGLLIETAKGQAILITGVMLEAINALSVLGIAFLLFPVLKQVWRYAAHAFMGFRILESMACLSAALIPLFAFGDGTNLRTFHTGTLIPLFFCGGAFVFYTVLFKHQLLPRFIAIWGWIGVLLIIYLNVYQPQGESAILFALPIISNEIFLGIWLISKGLNYNPEIKKT